MPIVINEKGVHMIYRDGYIIGFFTRDEKSHENIIFTANKASLDDIRSLLNNEEGKKI